MKNEIKKQTNSNVYPTIKKLSLAMTIIYWVAFVITIVGGVLWLGDVVEHDMEAMMMYVTFVGGGLMILALFLAIGQIVLAKKVSNVTPKITNKQSIIVFALGFGLALLMILLVALFYLLKEMGALPESFNLGMPIVILGAIAILAYLMITIMSTIIVAQIKVKQPAKKGK